MKDIDIFNEGRTYAMNIRDQKTISILKGTLIQNSYEIMKAIECAILKEINSELNPKDVKIYSNEKLRQAELIERLKIHKPYQDSKLLVDASQTELEEIRIGIDYSQNMLRLLIAFLT